MNTELSNTRHFALEYPDELKPHPLIFTDDPTVELHLICIPGQSFVNG